MDKIILGLLILKRLTAYEIRNVIRQNYRSMCSDSLGSIQVTLKKILSSDLVTCTEFVEKGVNKKQYSITDLGRTQFIEWLKTPMNMSKSKNMELSKLLRMGLVPSKERIPLINEIILILEQDLCELNDMLIAIDCADEKKQMINYYSTDLEYSLGIKESTQNLNMIENVDELMNFSLITIKFGIDSTKFHIEWFEKLKITLLIEVLEL